MNKFNYLKLMCIISFIGLVQSPDIYANLLNYKNDYMQKIVIQLDLDNIFFIKKVQESKKIVEIYKTKFISNIENYQLKENLVKKSLPISLLLNEQIKDEKITNEEINTNVIKENILTVNNSAIDKKENSQAVIKTDKLVAESKKSVLLIGDSMMGQLSFSLKKMFKQNKIFDKHKASTGLSNLSFYDWGSELNIFTKEYSPDSVFIFIGTNDAQGILENHKSYKFGSDDWISIYKNRFNDLLTKDASLKHKITVVSLPLMKDANFENKIKIIREIQKKVALANNISYIDSNIVLANENKFLGNVNSKSIRASDGIHLSIDGANMVAELLKPSFD